MRVPELGDIARARDVGIGQSYHKAMWHACVTCTKERWVLLRRGEPQSQRCYECSRSYPGRIKTVHRGPAHWKWNGGRSVMKNGYIEVWVSPDDPLFAMAGKDGYVYEHRIVVARSLGRCLSSDEEVHHLDGDKHNNAPSNLELLTKSEHAARHASDVMTLLKRVAELEAEVARLRGTPDDAPQALPS
jgi:hypothetical protein